MSDLREVTASREIEAIREDIAQLREDLKSLMGKVGSIGGNVAEGLGAQASDALEDAKDMASKMANRSYKRATKEAQRYADTVEKSIADHPFGTAMIALAIGLVLAKLFDRPAR
jgi:ElaB/YqjD/DUF883 family membrane-anchored ribosome-binding protein